MTTWTRLLGLLAGMAIGPWLLAGPASEPAPKPAEPTRKVVIIPIREPIDKPLVYLVRRGVKQAIEEKADLLILDMETDGGLVNVTMDIIDVLDQFKGPTATYVNKRAFSAGAFISLATQKIFMAPGSVIGAAAPMLMVPGGGPQEVPSTVEAKMVSAISALVRARAEKNGYNKQVVQAMIDKTTELVIDGKTLNKEGQILTLTNQEAEEKFGEPPKPLLSSGTVDSLDDLLEKLDYRSAQKIEVKPTGAEKVGTWISAISPILLIIGIIGLYIEFKTPGFGLPGIIGILAFVVYFFGGYVSGLSGLEWLALFILGLILVALELFVFPGTVALGVGGAVLMLVAIVMALADVYPAPAVPGSFPSLPRIVNVRESLQNLAIALAGTFCVGLILSYFLPRTQFYRGFVSQSVSGEAPAEATQQRSSRVGSEGTAISPLRPGGKAQFGQDILDVVTQGELLPKGARVRIISHSGPEAVVEAVT